MLKAPIPSDEDNRLKTLREYQILDTEQDFHLDEITKTAALICECEISLISLTDKNRQWFKSKYGFELNEVPRDTSYSGHVIMSDDIFVIEDSKADKRFYDNPLFLKEPHIRFYAGAPLIASNGQRIGALCVTHSEPKTLTEDKKILLKSLASQVMSYLELRKTNLKQSHITTELKTIQNEHENKLRESQAYKKGMDLHSIIARTDKKGRITYVNDKFCEASGYSSDELIGKDHRIISSGTHTPDFFKNLWTTINNGHVWRGEIRNKTKSGRLYWVDTTILPLKNKASEIEEFMSFRYDITAKKEAEVLYDETQKIAKIGGWDLNIETMEVNWTNETYRIHEIEIGTPANAEYGISFYAEHERPRITKLVTECIQKGIPFESDFEFITALGNKRWVQSKGIPEYDKNGKVVRVVGTFQDITEQKNNQIKIKEKENKLKQLFVQSQDALMTLEPPTWKFTSCNPATLNLFNISSEKECVNLGPWDVSPEYQPDGKKSSDKAKISIEKALKDGFHFFEWTHKTLDGKEIPCTVLLSRINENNKQYLHAVVRDISSQKKLEKEILDTNSHLDLALEGAGLGIWDWDLKTNAVSFDQRWTKMLGLDHQKVSMNSSTWESLVHHHDLEGCLTDLKNYIDGKTKRYENIRRMKHAEGHWVYILDRGRFSEWDSKGNPIKFTGTYLDITEAKEREKELSLILENTDMGIWKFNPITQELFWDKSMYNLYEVNPNDFSMAYDAWLSSLHPDSVETAPREFMECLENSLDFNTSFKILTSGNETKHIGARAVIERDENGKATFVTGVNWDRTKEQQAIDEMHKQMHIAQHHAKLASIGELAAGVGHEINNPLAIIKGYVTTISKKIDKDPQLNLVTLNSYLKKINVAASRIALIVQGLRTFSRSDSSEISEFYFIESLNESFDMVNEIYEKDGVQMSLNNNIPFTELIVNGNRGKFQQIIMNLLSNAKDAVSDSEEKSISINCDFKDSSLILKVQDSGCGIPESLKEKIFDPFFTTKEVNKGTGIGLTLVNNFIKEMNGTLQILSEENQGTTFVIELPAVISNASPTAKQQTYTKSSKQYKANVLLADDEAGIRELFSDMLESMGLDITSVENGQLAYDLYCKNPDAYDLIISDMKMPKMDGPSLLKSIRQKEIKQPKFIFITGGININFEDKNNELNKLIDGYFFKPFDEKKVSKIISSCLKKHTVRKKAS